VPEHALVLCCDDKSQMQALDRTQSRLPMKKGRAATMTQDYKRNGTITLFAALMHSMARSSPNFDYRQLRYAQAPKGSAVAGQTSSNHHVHHTHQCFVAQYSGAFF
jgi:hypothetical protein